MEALSGIASGMAVVSLAIQLVGTVSTIKTFIRNVKDSRKELERLIDLLERLEGLLEDIRDLLERQSSMGHYLPMPSMTIFRNLQSCEKTLQTLNELVEKLGTSMSLAGTASTRLKSGLKIGMKTKGIADMEVRIDREINYLHICLGANLSAISNRIGEYESRIKLLESLLNERNAKQPELHKQPVWHETEPTVPLSSWVDSLRDEVNFGSRPEFPDLNPFDLDPVVGGNDDAITEDIAELSVMETGQNNLTTDSSSQISTEDMQPSEEFQEDAAFLQSAEFEPGIASQTPPPMPVQPPCDGYLPPPEVETSLLAEFLTDMNTACPLYQPHVIADHLRVCYAGLSDGSVVAWTNAYVVFGIAHNLRAMSTTGTIHDMEMAQYYFARVYTALNRLLTAPSSLGQVQCLIGVELLIMGSPCSYNKSEGHFISTALRIARSLVYHHDTTGPAVVPDDTAQLRRVFWIAFINDSNLSIINNTPRTFRLEDVAESAELIANELGTVTAAEGDWQVHIFFLSTRLALLQTEAIDQVLSLRTRNTDPLELAAAATIVLARLQAFHQQHQVFQRDANELFQLLYQSDVVHCVVLESKYFATVYRLHAFMALDMNAKINPFELEGLSMMSRLKHQSVVREAKRLLSLLSVAPRGNIALYWMIHPILAAALVTVFAHHINNPKNEALTSTEMLVYKQVLINFDVMLQAGVNPDLEQNKGLYLGMFTRVEEEIRMR
ncbi:Fungal specific transcription factor domain-containing protein [Pyrenophora tritici-repentis]|nr:Fungal specific transcription factor domain-containing protein [Pyrenophora tritici-repentis]